MRTVIIVPILVVTVYLLTSLVIPFTFKGNEIYFAHAAAWATILAAILFISKRENTNIWKTNKQLLQLAITVAVLQIFLLIFVSFFLGFGQNPTAWTPFGLAVYFPYLLTPLLAQQFTIAYLAKTANKQKYTLTLLLTSLLITMIGTPVISYLSMNTPVAITEFLIRTFIPTLAITILSAYLAYLGGLPASLTYMAIPAFFTWFSPILPNPPWQAQAMIIVAATAIGFLFLDTATQPLQKQVHRTLRKPKSQLPYWTAIALIGLIGVWSTTGLLGFTPTIVASTSMTPTYQVGDIAIIINVPLKTIQKGDIIQYATPNENIVHRVIDIYPQGGALWFTTKGDANNAPDPLPVTEQQIMGKAVLTIPKLGWASIAIKEFASLTYTFFTATVPQTLTNAGSFILTNGVYITAALAFTAYSYLLLTYRTIKKEEKT